jgi:hypothetical protein
MEVSKGKKKTMRKKIYIYIIPLYNTILKGGGSRLYSYMHVSEKEGSRRKYRLLTVGTP